MILFYAGSFVYFSVLNSFEIVRSNLFAAWVLVERLIVGVRTRCLANLDYPAVYKSVGTVVVAMLVSEASASVNGMANAPVVHHIHAPSANATTRAMIVFLGSVFILFSSE